MGGRKEWKDGKEDWQEVKLPRKVRGEERRKKEGRWGSWREEREGNIEEEEGRGRYKP